MQKNELLAFANLAESMATTLDAWINEDPIKRHSVARFDAEGIASQIQELRELLDTAKEKEISFAAAWYFDVNRLMQNLSDMLVYMIKSIQESQKLGPWNTVMVDPEYIAITSKLPARAANAVRYYIIGKNIISLNVLKRMSLEDWLKVRNCGEQTAPILFNAFHQD